jgi:hypothetical protein
MNACRLSPRQGRYRTGWNYLLEGGVATTAMSALGQKQTYALQQTMSALHPIATAKADMPKTVMSALPPKADACGANRHVCFGPIADSCSAAKKIAIRSTRQHGPAAEAAS